MQESESPPQAGRDDSVEPDDQFATMSMSELREFIRDAARRVAAVRAEFAGIAEIAPMERTREQSSVLDLGQRTDAAWTDILRRALACRDRMLRTHR